MAFKFRGFRKKTEVSRTYILGWRRRSLGLIENLRHQTHIDYNMNIIFFLSTCRPIWIPLGVDTGTHFFVCVFFSFSLCSYPKQMEDT